MLSQDRDRPTIPLTFGPPPTPDVALIHWPDDDVTRRRLRTARRPRLLLVPAGTPPPIAVDEMEDWIRVPADPEELEVRIATLAARTAEVEPGAAPTPPGPAVPPVVPAVVAHPPDIDDHGVLRRGGRWVALAPIELLAVDLLLRKRGEVVRRDELTRACWPDGPPADARAVDGVVKRLRRRITPLGLRVHTVTGKGFLLDVETLPDPGPDAGPDDSDVG